MTKLIVLMDMGSNFFKYTHDFNYITEVVLKLIYYS